jgi:hypothetical protein
VSTSTRGFRRHFWNTSRAWSAVHTVQPSASVSATASVRADVAFGPLPRIRTGDGERRDVLFTRAAHVEPDVQRLQPRPQAEHHVARVVLTSYRGDATTSSAIIRTASFCSRHLSRAAGSAPLGGLQLRGQLVMFHLQCSRRSVHGLCWWVRLGRMQMMTDKNRYTSHA